MAITTTKMHETPSHIDWKEEDATIGYVGYRREWKSGSPEHNREQLRAKVAVVLPSLKTLGAGTAALSNTQRDAQIRELQKTVANLVALVTEDLSTPGQ